MLHVLGRAVGQRNQIKGIQFGKAELKLSFFVDDVFLKYMKILRNLPTNKLSKFEEFKTST